MQVSTYYQDQLPGCGTKTAGNTDLSSPLKRRISPSRIAESGTAYNSTDAKYWLAVQRAPGIGCRTYLKLLMAFGSAEAIVAASDAQLKPFCLSARSRQALRTPNWQAIQQDLDWLVTHNGQLVTLADTAYPALLKQIADPPPVLFVLGNTALLARPQIAMVGSRNPTPGGAQTACDFAAALVQHGLTVTSGMALGIDGYCHQGALSVASNTASSIAVIGTGIDRVYPSRHKPLAQALAQHGAIVSEFPPGTPPRAHNFPLRNRIISGLSAGVVVVEAALQSGSLITAQQALEQNREVFAIPGSIHAPQSRGCHALIRQGAKLVETAEDVLEELPFCPVLSEKTAPAQTGNGADIALNRLIGDESGLDKNHRRLLSCVGFEPTSRDEIIARCGLTAEQVCSMLLALELQNLIISTASGQYTRVNVNRK